MIAVAALGAFVYASFVAGVWVVFRKVQPDTAGLRVVKGAAVVAAVAEVASVARAPDSAEAAALGIVLYALSFAGFAWAAAHTRARRLSLAFSEDTPAFVLTTGPWRWVRHPFYASYLLSYVAGLAASRDLRLLLVVGAMTLLYVHAARFEERKLATSLVAPEWGAWRDRTGMLLPRL